MHHATADGQLLLHTLREIPAQLIPLVRQFKPLQQLLSVAVVLQPIGSADELQVFRDGEHVIDSRGLRDVGQQSFGLGGFISKPADGDLPLEPEQTRNALDDGGFSRPVGAQEDGNLSLLYLKTDVIVG